jgi:predicted CXXCH cytochrome family protein
MSALVGVEGERLRSSNGEVDLTLPAGAFESSTTVSVVEREEDLPSAGILRLAGVYEITPSGPLGASARLRVRYDMDVEHFQVAARLLAAAGIMTLDEVSGEWVTGSPDTTRSADGYIEGSLDHFSYWTGATIQPHGTNPTKTDYCTGVCHDLSSGPGSGVRLEARDSAVCYNCHGNTTHTDGPAGATGDNVEGSFYQCDGQTTPASASTHPVAEGDLYCTTCHNPHGDPAKTLGLLRSYDAITGKAVTSGEAYCWSCHGAVKNRKIDQLVPGYYTRSDGDKKTYLMGTAHAAVESTGSSGSVCATCHAPHGSANGSLIKAGEINGQSVTGNDASLCLACHDAPVGAYAGETMYQGTLHGTVSSSTAAATVLASSGASAGGCQNCHDPHGTANADYLVKPSSELCAGCHDAAGLTYPADYSYRGPTAFDGSGHSSITRSLTRVSLDPTGDGFAAWESAVEPTPSSPGQAIGEAGLAALRSLDSTRQTTGLQTTTGAYDYQMYRFKLPVTVGNVLTATLSWAGYGEETAGYPVVVSLWRPGSGTWEPVANRVMGTQQAVEAAIRTADHVDAQGYVHVMAKARYVNDGQIVSGPTFTTLTNTSVRVDWVTAGNTTSWVDHGLTTAYGTSTGSDTRSTAHSVTIAGLGVGTWHFRVRSASTNPGESYSSADFAYAIPKPTVTTAVPGSQTWLGTPLTTTVNWNAMAGAATPYSYRVQLYHGYKGGTLLSTSSWLADLSYTYTDLNAPGYYSWRVEARDKDGVSHGWSDYGLFYFGDGTATGSCPFLFTGTGEEYVFEADLFTASRIGGQSATGFMQPNPNDAYILKNLPAEVDGRVGFKLVEERYEVDYLDSLRLYAIDAPAGTRLWAQKAVAGKRFFPAIEDAVHTTRMLRSPVSAVRTDTGADILVSIAEDDGTIVELNEDSETDFTYKTLEIDLGPDVASAPQVKIVMNAVSEFPVTPEGIERRFTFGLPTSLQVQDLDGTWRVVPTTVGAVPAAPEFVRPYVFDLTNATQGTTGKVRFTFLFRTLIDWVAVDTTADEPVTITPLPLERASLSYHGVDEEIKTPGAPTIEYGLNVTDGAYFPGAYTRYGNVGELLVDDDDRFVVMGQGDEISLEYGVAQVPAVGQERSYLFTAMGYYKDMKTAVPKTVEPLPFAAMSNYPYPETESYPTDAFHTDYLQTYNTRVVGEDGVGQASSVSVFRSMLRELVSVATDIGAEVLVSADGSDGLFPVNHRSLNTDQVSLKLTVDGSSADTGACLACHAVHGATEDGEELTGGRSASDGRTCTADGTGGCHDNAANSASGIDIRGRFTANADPRAHHDVLRADQLNTGARTACGDCHNPHANNAVDKYADPDDISVSPGSALASMLSASGEVYVLVGAAHDATNPVISNIARSAPGASYASPTITWTTNEGATSWIDWGVTTAYELGNQSSGTPFGNNVRVTSHAVQMTGLTPGTTYHYRIRTADALGNTSYSADFTYKPVAPPTAPVMSDLTTVTGTTGWGPVAAPLDASTVASSDGHGVEYQFYYSGYYSPWLATPAHTTPAIYYDGLGSARVRARDAVDTWAVSDWSAYDIFSITNAADTGSCPFLFSWDGANFAWEGDLYTTGKLASPRANGTYQKPNPHDYYVLDNGPALKDGQLELRLVEERFETDYLDTFKLFAIDLPADQSIAAEKIPQGGVYEDLAEIVHTVSAIPASMPATVYPGGEDVSTQIAASDGELALLGDDVEQPSYHSLELDLGDLAGAETVRLIVEGMSRFPDTEEGKALSTAGVRQKVEIIGGDGQWTALHGTWPKPAEFARPYLLDLTGVFPTDDHRVRLTFLLKTYIDSVLLETGPASAYTATEVPLASADLHGHGMDAKSSDGDVYQYVYGEPNDSRGYFPGNYTKYGEVSPLLAETDDMFVIFGGGDEVTFRFDALPEPAEGMTRHYVVYACGYYKDGNTDVPKTVDPLPFSAMSNYPYGADEHYPDDAAHQEYQVQWNTRFEETVYDRSAATVAAVASAPDDVVWRELHTPVALAEVETEFSVDTDYLRLAYMRGDDTTSTASPAAGWESESAAGSKPTPAVPGTAVSGGTLGNLSADDGVYWRTNLASADGRWNWQLVRFDLGESALADLKDLGVIWNGHGEPTTGYPTAVYIWNPQTSAWVLVKQAQMPSDNTVSHAGRSVSDDFCMSCHDGTPPDGVVFPASVRNIGPGWTNTSTGDIHGDRAGSGYGTAALKAPYSRGQDAISCAVCHDTHGDASLYHVPEVVNGRPIAPVANSAGMADLCRSCHEGSAYEWHDNASGGCWCHYVDKYEPGGHDDAFDLNDSIDCLSCHGHSKNWTHPGVDCEDCHSDIGTGRAF